MNRKPAPKVETEVFGLLSLYYAALGLSVPSVVALEPFQIPQPQRRLLVHDRDMTPTLEGFHQQSLRVQVLQKMVDAKCLLRTVVLVGMRDGKPVEFGAIRINLGGFDRQARSLILECRVPLGGILRDKAIHHTSRPNAYFSLTADEAISQALGLQRPEKLFGRQNDLRSSAGERLADVVEILPPAGDPDFESMSEAVHG